MITALVARWRRHLVARSGWRGAATTLGLGALVALALPPVHLVPVLWLAFPGLLFRLEARPGWRAACATGFWFGLGFFLAGLYWITFAILHEAARFFWLVPLAVPAIAAGLALFIAPVAVAAAAVPAGMPRVLVLAAAWTLSEMARGVLFTGFPWNLIGTVWAFDALPLQPAAYVGVHGLSLATVKLAALPALLVAPARPWRSGRLAAVLAAAALVWGGVGVARQLPPEPPLPGPLLRIVQGNIPQDEKWASPEARARNFQRYLVMSAAGSPPPEGHALAVIWPETASPFPLETFTEARRLAAQTLPPGGVLLAGTVRVEEAAPAAAPGGRPRYRFWNSMVAVTRDGALAGRYDKAHLVPFGEYVPLRWLLPFGPLVQGGTDFSAGPGPRTLDLPGLPPVSPLICYEVIFPGAVTDPARRPGWLLNLTNDAWFGTSSGPYQHLAAARLRAVEEGLPLARAANTGISAVFDARGRTVARIGLNLTGVLEAPLPGALPPTLFARLGLAIPLLLALLALAAGLHAGRRRTQSVNG